jgi:hypothetical protein
VSECNLSKIVRIVITIVKNEIVKIHLYSHYFAAACQQLTGLGTESDKYEITIAEEKKGGYVY